jgi:hypothetical protein
MIEERVKGALERAARSGPGEEGGYDRFLRRRRRANRAVTAATSVALVAVLGLAAALPRVRPAPQPTTPPATQATTPAVDDPLSSPLQGFELDRPGGWVVELPNRHMRRAGISSPTIHLVQRSPRAAEMTISTGLIHPRYNALLGHPYRGARPPDLHYLELEGTATAGKRPDGRPYLWTLRRERDGFVVLNYYVSWPYRCALGPEASCPAPLGLRVLRVEVIWTKLADPADVRAVAERLVRTARPIGNAVDPSPVPGQAPCRANRLDRLGTVTTYRGRELRDPKTGEYALAKGSLVANLRLADYPLVFCHLGQRIAVLVVDGDRPAAVRRNGLAAPSVEALLEPLASGPLGTWADWQWTNWCGSRSAEAWYVDPDTRPVRRLARIAAGPPPCIDARYPSVLQGGHIAPD